MSSLVGTLGFFRIGIPVLFVRSDICAGVDQSAWMQDPSLDLAINPISAEATIRHEIRHFHDALLSPFVFERFMLELQRNYTGAVICARRAAREAAGQPAELTQPEQTMLDYYQYAVSEHRRRFSIYESKVFIDAIQANIDIFDLMETNAILTEVQFAALLGGHQSALAYWSGLSRDRDERYSSPITLFLRGGELTPAHISNLHRMIVASLACKGHPGVMFNQLSAQFGSPAALSSSNPVLADLVVRGIRDAELFPSREYLPSSSPFVLKEQNFRPGWEQQFVQPAEIAIARTTLAKAIVANAASLPDYVRDLERFPIPPTCFYADEQMLESSSLPFTRKGDLRRQYGDVFTLCHRRDRMHRTTISAGYIPTLGIPPFISLRKIDSMLSFRYLSQQLFGEKVSYSTEIDQAYADAFEVVCRKLKNPAYE